MRLPSIVLLLVGLTAVAFWPVLDNGFITFDDALYVTKNPQVRAGLTLAGIRWAFTTSLAANWHPLTWISHMIDVEVYAMRAWGHHLTSLLLHVANVLLLFFVLDRMTARTGPSAVVAGLFAVHPLHVESVAWVAERKDVLSALFFLLTLWAYVHYVAAPSRSRFAAVVVLLAAGLSAKPMLVTLPFVLLLIDFWPLGRSESWGQLVREKLPLLPAVLASCIVTVVVQNRGGSVSSLEDFPPAVRAASAVVAYGAYLWNTVWPRHLAFYYPHPGGMPSVVATAGVALVLAVVTVLAVRERRRRPYLLVGWLWYLGMLVPVSGIVQVGGQAMADRYTYLPLIGIFIAVTWLAGEALEGKRVAWRLAVAAVLVPLVFVTRAQARVWRDSVTLYEHALAVTGNNAVVATFLGATLAQERRHAEAIPWYERALEANPAYVKALVKLGEALAQTGRPDAAMARIEQALRLDPTSAEGQDALGVALARLNRPREALARFEEAIRLRPDFVEARTNAGSVLLGLGRAAEGIRRYEEALELDPDFAEAHTKLGLALAQRGELGAAKDHLARAVEIDPAYPDAHQNLAMALYLEGEYGKAWEQIRLARRLGLEPQPSLLRLLEEKVPEPRR